jgi:protein-glutamine gamma-glutamyltransferase
VSRLQFRATVDAPRPASAWAMATVASATLWITEQLDPWVVVFQALALLFSLQRRLDPHPWQRSAVALNVGMVGIVLGTIVVALRGDPSTIALAHFAAPTQGLQLLDARPRRTEFLLVALALFQVVLAANLTDSVFFPPLLVAFLFTTVWTLIVHTLRSEALEAGAPGDASRALTPGLLRTAALASFCSILIAALLFVTLPRLRSSVLTGPGLGRPTATAGFSDEVAFGALGRIRQDSRVVLRVETLEGEPPGPDQAYWRGLAFDHFDGERWRVTPSDRLPVAGSAEGGVSIGSRSAEHDLVQRIVREPVASGVLFSVGEPRGLHGTIRRLERDTGAGLYATGQDDERVRYTMRSQRTRWGDAALRRDRASPPLRDGARYLQLPPLGPAFDQIASDVARGAQTDADRARAIERHLLTKGRYTDSPPSLPEQDPRTPVEVFLEGGMAGHCEYFASAMVLLARRNGLPARLVNGFAGGHENSIGDFVELTRSDAHAWVEIHYEKAGWVRYDPTPADLRARAQPPVSLATRLRELGSALELWWFQRVVGFDRADQIGALRQAWLAWKRRDDRHVAATSGRPTPRPTSLQGPWREAGSLLLCAGALAGLALSLWRRNRRSQSLPASYAQALRMLARRGCVRRASQPARDFARDVRDQVPPRAADVFDTLTERYLAARFGGARFETDPAAVRRLREALRRRRA